MSVFEKYVPAAMDFLASGYNPDMEPAILKRCLYILLELSEAGQKLEAENERLCVENADLKRELLRAGEKY